MRPTVPTAISGPGVRPDGDSLAGLAEHAATIVGNSGRAAFVTAKTVMIRPGSVESVPLTVDMTNALYTNDMMRVNKDTATAAFLINNNGVVFCLRGLSVSVQGDANVKINMDQTDGSISLGDGIAPPDWKILWLSANTATLGADDNLIIPGTLTVGGNTVTGGYASFAKWGTD